VACRRYLWTTIRRLFPSFVAHLSSPLALPLYLNHQTASSLPIWTIEIVFFSSSDVDTSPGTCQITFFLRILIYLSKTIRFPCLYQTQHIALDVAHLMPTPTNVRHIGRHPPENRENRGHFIRLPSPFIIDTYFPNTPSTKSAPRRPPPHAGALAYLVRSLRLAQTTTCSANSVEHWDILNRTPCADATIRSLRLVHQPD